MNEWLHDACRRTGQKEMLIRFEKGVEEALLQELRQIDWRLLSQQRAAIDAPKQKKRYEPLERSMVLSAVDSCSLLSQRTIGCLIMAGGIGSRLGISEPKGVMLLPCGKSLLQIFLEKAQAFQKRYQSQVFIGIMTSSYTDAAIKRHLEERNFFGFNPKRVRCFQQDSLPFLDENGQLVLVENHVATGPDGNGRVFSACMKSGVLDLWKGVEAISVIPIDNPLLDPFYPEMLSPIFEGKEMSIAAVRRRDGEEEVGVFVRRGSRIEVVEYSEDGLLYDYQRFPWANISYFVVSPAFVRRANTHELPLHMAHKQFRGEWIWKTEYFIFDHLPFARSFVLVPMDRDRYFAPIKRAAGKDSILSSDQAVRRVAEESEANFL